MILQALTRYYEDLLAQGKIDAPGWAPAKISFALYLDENGELTQVVPMSEEVAIGRKTVIQPCLISLPVGAEKTSNSHLMSNFLWEDSGHFLGIDQKGNAQRGKVAFSSASKLHHTILDGVDSPIARAILPFFDTWKPECAVEHPALVSQIEDITTGGNLLFRVEGRYPQEDTAIQKAWQQYWEKAGEKAVWMQCLVTGKYHQEIARTHHKIKGSPKYGFQTMGNSLVSFNNELRIILRARAELQRPSGEIRCLCLYSRTEPSACR